LAAASPGAARVLVVDDDPALLESVGWVLRDQGYDVATAGGAAALVAHLDAARDVHGREGRAPDLVVLDVLLPDGDGVALLERIKRDERWRDVPVLMLSSAPAEEYTVRALGLGAADFVRKPVRPRELVARVQAHLRAGAALRTTRDALRRAEEELVRARADAENRRKLVDILHDVTGDLAADDLYQMLARRVARAMSVSHCAVLLAEGAGDAGSGAGACPAMAAVATAFEDPRLRSVEVSLDRFPEVGEALATMAPVLVEELATDPRYGAGVAATGLDGRPMAVRSALALPFAADRGRRGAFLLRRTREQPPLTRDDVAFAEAVIGAAVAVVQRAHVIETARADNARLEHLATTDPLTALLNRRALTDRLTTEMERALRYDGTVALLLIDLDHFKRVNDTHGHLVGDAVLRGVAELLVQAVRTSDLVGRYGGEEFLVVLPETDDEGAAAFAERVRERVAAHEFRGWDDGRALRMTASIGVATFPAARIESVVDLFARADAALYRAKADGRDRVRM
jgi:two-component system cell cycle response regulator